MEKDSELTDKLYREEGVEKGECRRYAPGGKSKGRSR